MFESTELVKNNKSRLKNSPHLFSISRELFEINEDTNFNESWEIINKEDNSSSKNKSEKTFELMVSASKDAIVMINNNGKVSFWNKAAEKIFGYTEEEILNKDLHKILAPKYLRVASMNGFEKFRQTGSGNEIGKTLELSALRKNGEEFPIELSLSAFQIENEWNSIGVVRDISERKEKEEKIKQQAAFVNNNPAPVLKSNKEGIILEANPSAKEIHGSELINKNISTIFPYFNKMLLQDFKKNHFAQFEEFINDKAFLITVKEDSNTNAYYFYGSDITEKKRVEAELRESEVKFKSLVQNSSLGIYRSNKSGEILFANPALLHMLGYKTIDELREEKKAIDLYVDPEEREIFQSILGEEGTIFDFETKLKRRDGAEILVKESSKQIKNLVNKDIIYQGVIHDISQQKKDEVQIKKLHRAIEQSSVSVVITDSEGNIEYVNPKFEDVTGYTSAEAIGVNPRILKSGEQNSEIYKNLWDTITSGNVWKGEFHNKKKNGELFWEAATISPVKDENGIITNFVAVKEDITESKLMIEKLKENEEMLEVTTEASEDAFYRLSFDNMNYDYMHPNIEKLTGYSPQEINFSSILEKIEENNKPISTENLINLRNEKEDEIRVLDYLIKTKNGELKWLADRSYPWYDNSGNIKGSIGVLTDLTKRKEIEKKLFDAKEDAESASNMKTEFINQISHEVRTPLNIILSFIELLKDDLKEKIGEEEFENLNIIDANGRRLIRTIDSVLNLSEIHSGNYEPVFEDVNLFDEVLDHIYNEYRLPAEEKSLKFTLLNNVKHTLISVDKYSITQIFSHLIDNSIKFTNSGNVEISLTSSSGKLVVRISDTGIGISEKYLSKIFNSFTQEEHGATRRYEGNGIGLALVKQYCDLNNITIKITTLKSKGTTIQLVFNNSKIDN